MSETELLQAVTKGWTEEAFAELVRRYAGLVYSVAKRRVSDPGLAEDVTQVVFIRFAKNPPRVKTHGELVGWLHRTTLNVAIDTWRSESRRRNREQQAVVMEPNTQSAWQEISPQLDEAVNRLEDEDRQAILLRFFKEKSMRDIGAALGVSEAAAKMRVSRAVERLRKQLGTGGIACTAAVLGMVVAEHSIEAAPVALVSRLAAMRLAPAAAKVTGSFRAGFKVAAGLLAIGLVGFYFIHSRSTSPPAVVQSATPTVAAETIQPVETPHRAAARVVTNDPLPVQPERATKILLHVLDSETGFGLPQTAIKYIFFGRKAPGESHYILTDQNGDARILEPDDATKNVGPNVFVTAEGHVPKAIVFQIAPTNGEYTVRLDPALTVGGTVVDEQGFPVSDVAIFVGAGRNEPWENGKILERIDFQACPVTNHQDGTWICSYIPKDLTNGIGFVLKKPGYATSFPSVPMPQANLSSLVLVIQRGFTIAGSVADQQGRPLAQARIKALAGGDIYAERKPSFSDGNGFYALTGVPGESSAIQETPLSETNSAGDAVFRGEHNAGPWHVELSVQADGFAGEVKTVDLVPGTNTVNFVLSPGNVFRGHVVDDLGNAVSNAVVETDVPFLALGNTERAFDWTTNTDANGGFEWDSAPAQTSEYSFKADGYYPVEHQSFVADGSDHKVTLPRNSK